MSVLLACMVNWCWECSLTDPVVLYSFVLGVFGIMFGLAGVMLNDWPAVRAAGFFQGYNHITWIVIFLQVRYNTGETLVLVEQTL